MILAYDKYIKVFLNQKSLTTENEFCCDNCTNFALNDPTTISIPEGKTIKQQSLHFGDINIDGYPDLLIGLIDDKSKAETPLLFQNLFNSDKKSF